MAMKKNKNIIWYILIIVFGLIFVPQILNRLKSNDIVRSESSENIGTNTNGAEGLAGVWLPWPPSPS